MGVLRVSEVLSLSLCLAMSAAGQQFVNPDAALNGAVGVLEVGDSNGDGLADAYVNGISGRRIALGLPGGGFAPPLAAISPTGVPATARVRAFADVTGDGRDDLVLTVPGAVEIFVAVAQVDGTFADVVSSPLKSAVAALVASDVDGDGRLDVWYGEVLGTRATLLLSNGDGTFTSELQVAVPKRPVELVFADVSGDGRPDLISLSQGATSLETIPAVALATANGFSAAQPLVDPPTLVTQLRVADLTGDGVNDIGALTIASPFAPPNEPLAYVYVGGADIATQPPTSLAGEQADVWQLADLDADGTVDVITLEAAASKVVVRELLDGETLSEGRTVGIGSFAVASLTVTDADRDGALDIITGSTRGTLRANRGLGDGTFTPGLAATMPSFSNVSTAGDLDGDGLADVVTARSTIDGATLELHRGLLGPGFAEPERFTTTLPVEALALRDVDGDSDLDVVAWLGVVSAQSGIATLLNDGGALADPVEQVVDGMLRAPAFGDVTGDGLADVTVFPRSLAGGDVLRFVSLGDGTYDVVNVGVSEGSAVASIVGNVDDIPPLDVIAIAPVIGDPPAVIVVTGAGIAAAGTAVDVDPVSIAGGDWNGDGLTDFVAGRLGPGFEVRLNLGGGFFEVTGFLTETLAVGGFSVNDVDGDGDLDVTAAERGAPNEGDFGRLSVWLNDGEGEFEAGDVTILDQAAHDVVLIDIDEDSKLDAVVTSGDEFVVLTNADATWTARGQSLAGSTGFSRLDGIGPLTSRAEVTLHVRRATPGAVLALVIGFSEVAAPLKGGVLVPSPDIIITGLVTDAAGEFTLASTLPPSFPVDVEIALQAWQLGGGHIAATTAVLGVTH